VSVTTLADLAESRDASKRYAADPKAAAEYYLEKNTSTVASHNPNAERASIAAAVEERSEARFSERIGERAVEHFPVLGFYIALGLVEEDLHKEAYLDAVADLLGPIPVVGEVALSVQILAHSEPFWAWLGNNTVSPFYKEYPTPADFY
jgi:hypothetical protein